MTSPTQLLKEHFPFLSSNLITIVGLTISLASRGATQLSCAKTPKLIKHKHNKIYRFITTVGKNRKDKRYQHTKKAALRAALNLLRVQFINQT